jgi:hypothetical protein
MRRGRQGGVLVRHSLSTQTVPEEEPAQPSARLAVDRANQHNCELIGTENRLQSDDLSEIVTRFLLVMNRQCSQRTIGGSMSGSI